MRDWDEFYFFDLDILYGFGGIISTILCSTRVWLQLRVGFWQGTHHNLHLMYYVFHTRENLTSVENMS